MNSRLTRFAAELLIGATVSISLTSRAVAWSTDSVSLAQAPTEITYTTVRNDGGIDIQIPDGNYRVYPTLRPGENGYIGQDGISAVLLNPATGHVTVYSTETGETFYDYYIDPVDLGRPIGSPIARSDSPVTYMTPQNANAIAIQIADGGFSFYDVMYRTYGNRFEATDWGYRVMYDRDTGRVTVISDESGAELYNYFFSEADNGSGSRSSESYSSPAPETYITPESTNEITAELTEGEFYFYGPLVRSSGNTFVGSDGRVRVIYDRDTSRIVVINVVSGTEFYNYFFSEVDEGYL